MVYITFAITVILWMFDKVTGVNSNVVAMIPVAVFCITGVITKRDLEEIPANVLADLEIHPVKRIDDVLNIALQNPAYGALPVAAK